MDRFICAHEDIEPSKEWQKVIENALLTMDALIVLFSKEFHNSKWTDQEVGAAIGSKKFIIVIKLDETDPYGFIGKLQAINYKVDIKILTINLLSILVNNEKISLKYLSILIERFEKSENFTETKYLLEVLKEIKKLPEEYIKKIEIAYQNNDQIKKYCKSWKILELCRKWRQIKA